MELLIAVFGALTAFASARTAHAIIDPKFTPVELVGQAQTILVGSLAATADSNRWTLRIAETLKGDKADSAKTAAVSLAMLDKDQAAVVSKVFVSSGDAQVVLFASRRDADAVAYLHADGVWLSAKGAGAADWAVTQVNRKLDGSFAGGTDMLIRMTRYILADDRATVPVSVGTAWMRDPCRLGKLDGTVCGMAALEFSGDKQTHLFVASDKGDRLFRAKPDDEAFEDVTARSKLETRSRQFAWLDLDADGSPDLVSWDGNSITAWRRAKDGTFKGLGKPLDFKPVCLGLAACSAMADGAPAVLVSTADLPVLLARTPQGGWTATKLPGGDAVARAGPATKTACIVADLDNDGCWDVLQLRDKTAILWKGTARGWAQPARSAVTCSGGRASFALGDFNQDGFLDLFLSDPNNNEVWENDGKGAFKPVIRHAGSLGYKSAAGFSFCMAADLNHDGRADLCLLAAKSDFTYHFNRGFRCFGEEGDLRLAAAEDGPPLPAGQVACAAADFNADGSLDLAVAFADGLVCCFYNDSYSKSMLRVGLATGAAGPVTVSVWQDRPLPVCWGAASVHGPLPRACLPLGRASELTVRWNSPGKPDRTKKVKVSRTQPGDSIELLLEP